MRFNNAKPRPKWIVLNHIPSRCAVQQMNLMQQGFQVFGIVDERLGLKPAQYRHVFVNLVHDVLSAKCLIVNGLESNPRCKVY